MQVDIVIQCVIPIVLNHDYMYVYVIIYIYILYLIVAHFYNIYDLVHVHFYSKSLG